jgi:ABC-2 type transport system ATP-binding protein
MAPIIEVKDLTKRYKRADQNAVDCVSFNVEPGEFFALLGPNGAGKTTTISILTTTLSKTSGQARVAGYDVNTQAKHVRQNVGIIFQNPSLDINLTAEENIRFHSILYGLHPFRPTFSTMPRSYRDRVIELAEVLDIKDSIFKPLKTFSGGMKRKLEIMRGLIHRPKVLFLDEPTIGLDPLSRRNLWEYIEKVRAESATTILLTTHYLEEAEQAHKICIINKGHVVSYGSPADIKAQLLQAYLILDAEDRRQLCTELQSLGIPFTETPQIKINLEHRNLHQLIKSINTPLTVIQPHTPTLEDAYLAIVDIPAQEPSA